MRAVVQTSLRGGRGFTSVELMIGISITTVIMGALAAFSFAISTSWTQTQSSQVKLISGTITTARIQDVLRKARMVGLVRTGSTDGSAALAGTVVMWAGDVDGDGAMQLDEIAVLQHVEGNTAAESYLKLYAVEWPSNYTQAQIDAANWTLDVSNLNTSSGPEDFKSLSIVNGTNLAQYVTGAKFYLQGNGTRQRPTLEYTIVTTRDGRAEVEYGNATMRSFGEQED